MATLASKQTTQAPNPHSSISRSSRKPRSIGVDIARVHGRAVRSVSRRLEQLEGGGGWRVGLSFVGRAVGVGGGGLANAGKSAVSLFGVGVAVGYPERDLD